SDLCIKHAKFRTRCQEADAVRVMLTRVVAGTRHAVWARAMHRVRAPPTCICAMPVPVLAWPEARKNSNAIVRYRFGSERRGSSQCARPDEQGGRNAVRLQGL